MMFPDRKHDDRPWGSFEQFTQNTPSTVKIIAVAPNKRLSLQVHAHRSEFWRVIAGSGIAEVDGESRELRAGDEVDVPAGAAHRLTAGADGLSILEIALGDFDESDIVRLEDDFGRI